MSTNLEALVPRDSSGFQFLVYGDCCSGVPGAAHEATFAAVNAIVERISPEPEFICFLGDQVSGLTADYAALRAQWRHFLDHELAWLDGDHIPLFHTTGNHVTYDEVSEAIFREVLGLPNNGPTEQQGLSYYVRRDNLLLVFIHTSSHLLGGEGFVETEWLERTLMEHSDATYKLVLGHHPLHQRVCRSHSRWPNKLHPRCDQSLITRREIIDAQKEANTTSMLVADNGRLMLAVRTR